MAQLEVKWNTGLWTRVSIVVILASIGACSSMNDCRGIQYAYKQRGLNFENVPRQPTPGSHLEVCPRGLTCCTQDMENKLRSSAKENYKRAMQSVASPVQKTFGNGANSFNEAFMDLLTESKAKFDTLFKKTYGIIYERNKDVFFKFFGDLEKYYEHGDVNLEDALQNFFSQLYQRMFIVFNVQQSFDYVYMSCVSQTMRKLQPFGDVPKTLTEQLRRSFVATRTFAQALDEGKKILNKIVKIDPKDSCSNGFTRMSSCAPCQGIPEVQPCPKYCLNVMRGCLAYHYELSQSWDDFIAHIQQLSDRLLGPFDVEAVVTPIGVKISDAIMSFQNAGYDVTAKVVQECGPTRLQKRQAQYGHAYAVNPNPRPLRPDQIHEETKLNLLIKEIRGKLESTKLFWNRLPTEMCNNDLIRSDKGRQFVVCWNGTSAGHYASNLVGEGLRPQESNPEIRVDVSRQDVDINEQILALRRMTKHLDDAINGQDVNWPSSRATNYRQSDESRKNQSQETEGSGAGCNPNSDDEDCYQYYDDDYYGGSGSGSGDYQDYPIHPSKNNQSPQEGSYEDNWPPWITSKSKDDDIEIESKSQEGEGTLYGDMGVINVGQRPDNHSGKKKHSSSGGLSLHTLRGLLYYLVPLVTCWIGNAAISW